VDTTCSNLAIKYNMIYISVYQLIKHHLSKQTSWGRKLLATQRTKEITVATQVRDEFDEQEYSPVHYEQGVLMALIKATIKEHRHRQKFVIIEGMFNSTKPKH